MQSAPVYHNRDTGHQWIGMFGDHGDTRQWCRAWVEQQRQRREKARVRPVYIIRVRVK